MNEPFQGYTGPKTFTVLQVAPIVRTQSGRAPTEEQCNAAIGEAFRRVGPSHTTTLRSLQEALDDGVEVYLVRVAVNGTVLMELKLVRGDGKLVQ